MYTPPSQRRAKILNNDLGIKVGPFTVSEVCKAIQKMKKGKAAGHDKISIDWIKALNPSNTEVLTKALNKWWSQELIPEDHLKAMVVSILKKGNTQDIQTIVPFLSSLAHTRFLHRFCSPGFPSLSTHICP